jgi:electron transfer flavoprotein beta subunit
MRVLVCVKRVPSPGARINITDDGQAVDTAHLAFTTSPHEECAVESAAQLVEEHGGESTVLTLGPLAAEEQLRYAASVGIHRCVLAAVSEEWDPQRTATGIVSAIGELEATDGPFDLILFGNESADAGGFQVGIRVAHALDRPIVNGAKGLTVEGGHARIERATEAGLETYALTLPAVIGIKEGINLPRYPTMRGRLASKKAHIVTVDVDAAPGGLRKVVLERPPERESSTVILGHGREAAAAVVDLLDEIGVL